MKSFYFFILALCTSVQMIAQSAAGGWGHVLYICNDNTVRACGNNIMGQLGNGTTTNSSTSVAVSNMANVKAVRAGYSYSAALKYDSSVWTWGDNIYGQLGNGTTTTSYVPIQVNISHVKKIAAGTYHCMALKNDGTLWGWGQDTEGQLGDGQTTNSSVPVQTLNMAGVKDVEAGTYHTLALKNDGTVWAWGQNNNGELGNGNFVMSTLPVQVSGLTNVVAISAGQHFSVALKADGTVWTWGYNYFGSLGKPSSVNNSNIPVQVDSLSNVKEISVGCFQLHTYAIKHDGSVWAWGNNDYGQLGMATPVKSYYAVQVPGLTNINHVFTGNVNTIITKADNTYWIAGWNAYGQLGDNTTNDSYNFIQPTDLCSAPNGVHKLIAEDFKVYPVPARDYVHIEFGDLQDHTLIEISDLSGRIINRYDCHAASITIPTSDFNRGVYIIRFSQQGNLLGSRKLIVE